MSEHTTQIPDVERLQRSRSDRMLAGVCGGLARYFEIHPAVFRVGFVVLTLLGGAGILIYAAAALVMPDEGKEDSVATAALRNRKDHPWPLIGLGLLAVAGALLLSQATLWPDGDTWFLFLIAGALILWVTRHSTEAPAATAVETPETAAQRPRRLRRVVVAIGLVVASLLAATLIALAAVLAVFDVDRSIGDRTYAVTSAQDLRSEYRLGIGSMKLDLTELQLPEGATRVVDARVDIGDLEVIAPSGVALQVHGTAEVGEVDLLGNAEDGRNVENDLRETGTRVLVLDAHVGAGAVRIERAIP
ncbi:MAG TPA: PspC domain-containing protein [Gaiellaceae bacterium]|jgi:phage shock protein PspC (stress-responsive transcriptional regulator)|nr:PspC domain-containing protein [Gaiellaceae bacterium]